MSRHELVVVAAKPSLLFPKLMKIINISAKIIYLKARTLLLKHIIHQSKPMLLGTGTPYLRAIFSAKLRNSDLPETVQPKF
jgi:hypothetical protein